MKNSRKQIDEIDDQIIQLLAKRQKIILEIAKYKKENNIDILDRGREEQILAKIAQLAKKEGLDPESINPIFEIMFEWSRNIQDEIN